jgi:hypothetical protein
LSYSHSGGICLCRQWEAMQEANASILLFEEWVKGAVQSRALDLNNPIDMDRLLLTTKPFQEATWYGRIKAFGNHFSVADESSVRMQTYDCRVASVFQVPTSDAQIVSVNYVGVLQDILKLNYGPCHTLIILLQCKWMKRHDNICNPTYTRNKARFLLVNISHKLP